MTYLFPRNKETHLVICPRKDCLLELMHHLRVTMLCCLLSVVCCLLSVVCCRCVKQWCCFWLFIEFTNLSCCCKSPVATWGKENPLVNQIWNSPNISSVTEPEQLNALRLSREPTCDLNMTRHGCSYDPCIAICLHTVFMTQGCYETAAWRIFCIFFSPKNHQDHRTIVP